MISVLLGSEQLLTSGLLAGARVGLVANSASIDHSFQHIADPISALPDTRLVALFGPQHGFYADVQDNMIETDHGYHPKFDIPIYSLYSDTREPTDIMFDGIDLLVIDLQDVGTRVYTYAYTMANCLRAAARHNIRVIVCDRPNPIGGEVVEGPVLEQDFSSFVGQFSIPLRHGLTIGELARLFNEHFEIGAQLTVSPLAGWSRDLYASEHDIPWIYPSPNLPTVDSTVVYPGTVLIEGTTLSEGRGTTRPFELIGAPVVNPNALALDLNALDLPGVRFRSTTFEPTFQKHVGKTCGGCQLHVTDRRTFRPVVTGVAVIQAFRRLSGSQFAWRTPPYEYELTKMPIDILAGSDTLRQQIDLDRDAIDIAEDWTDAIESFKVLRQQYLLY